MNAKTTDWIISVLLNTTILAFPFLISLIYKEDIQEKTLTIAVSMFLISVAIGSTEKILFYIFFIIAFFLAATYGAIPNSSLINGVWHYQIVLAFFGIIALIFDKYDIHVRKGEPLNYF